MQCKNVRYGAIRIEFKSTCFRCFAPGLQAPSIRIVLYSVSKNRKKQAPKTENQGMLSPNYHRTAEPLRTRSGDGLYPGGAVLAILLGC